MEFQIEVSSDEKGATAFSIVAGHLGDYLEHFLRRLFVEGHVCCGPHAVRPEQPLPPGTCLVVEVPDDMTPNIGPKPHPLDYLLEDDRLLAVDKPAGLTMLPGLGFEQISLFEAVWHHLKPSGDRPRIVNRIDKGTSGVVLFARDRDSQARLAGQFQRREVLKVYRALVVGRIQDESGEIDLPLAPHANHPAMMTVNQKEGKPSTTRYRVTCRFGHFTELELVPLTGRTHQIRVHLKAIGHPLAVDSVYGSSEPLLLSTFKKGYRYKDEDEERPLMSRTPLHASRLEFHHPADSHPVVVEAPLPKDLAVCLKQLTKWDPARSRS